MDKQMTDKDIIKALEYWVEFDEEINELLKKYPSEEKMLLEQKEIVNITIQTFKTFNRQKAEIGKLEHDLGLSEVFINKAFYNECQCEIKQARAEAIKEFAETLKFMAKKDGAYDYVSWHQIDSVEKELTRKEDEGK